MAPIDEVYRQRNQLAQLCGRLAQLLGWKVGVKDDYIDREWVILFIDTPKGQISYHVHVSELIGHWPEYEGEWDGHSTWEKLERIEDFLSSVGTLVQMGKKQ